MHPRLGLDLAREAWPTPDCLAAREAAGFGWIQVHAPSPELLGDRAYRIRLARALRAALDEGASRLVLHAPGRLRAGTAHGDRALLGVLDYAAETGAEIVVYHGQPSVREGDPLIAAEDARLEERALGRLARRATAQGFVLAIENLAPGADPSPAGTRPAHDALAVRDLVRRLDSWGCGMALDLGHLNLLVGGSEAEMGAMVAACASYVVLWNAHDNLAGAREVGAAEAATDVHLAPGRGSLPWPGVATFLTAHRAPLVVEIAPLPLSELPALAATTTALVFHSVGVTA